MSGPAQFPNSIMLTANSLQESIAFYVDVCGFTVKESWPEGNDPMWANLDLGGQSVMIGSAMQPEQVEGMCAEEPKELEWHKTAATEFQEHPAGIGAYLYLKVD
ncbi:MAG: VOC family protein, partial [Planctomycetota bacterium]